LIDYAGRDPAAPKSAADCAGKYEYMPDQSWEGSGTCTYTFKQTERQLGGGFALQGIHVQKYRWHRQIRRG
jgi:hypothetical protein